MSVHTATFSVGKERKKELRWKGKWTRYWLMTLKTCAIVSKQKEKERKEKNLREENGERKWRKKMEKEGKRR